jgi:hypothetical protein
MSTDSTDYALWVTLANDPNQSEDARQRYREQMEAYLYRKVREAFQFAAKQTLPTPEQRTGTRVVDGQA